MAKCSRCQEILFLVAFVAIGAILVQAQQSPSPVEASGPPTHPSASGTDNDQVAPAKEVIVVTGTFLPVPLSEINRSVSLMDVQDTPALFSHWTDHLKTDPSMDLRERAPNDIQADVSIRGSSFGQTLIMVNGLRMDDVQTGHHDLDLPLPTDSIKRIEVLRGAGSTLYGSDALGGAINFLTGQPSMSQFKVGADIGNFGVNQQHAFGSLIYKNLDEQLAVERDFSSGFAPDRDYRNLSIFSTSDLSTRLGSSLVMLGYADKPYGADQFYGPFASWERTKTWFASLSQDLGIRTKLDFGFRRHTDEFILIRDQPQIYENNHVTESWQAGIRREQPLGRNVTLFIGGAGDQDSIHSNNLGTHVRSHGAVYIDAESRLFQRFSISAGVREELFDSVSQQLSPSVAASYVLKSRLKLKASASRAFRLPSYTDLYYSDPANVGNPNLKPESAWSFDGGVEWNSGGRIRATATVFENRERDVIDYVKCATNPAPGTCPFTPANVYHAANIQNLDFTGVELLGEAKVWREHRITVAYTGLHGAQQALNGLNSRYTFNYPIHNAVVGLQGLLLGSILIRTRIGATERFDRDPYALWDLNIARQFGRVGAHLAFANLTNTEYEEIQGISEPGRSVVFGLEYTITGRKK